MPPKPLPPRVSSFFVVDEHRPVFDPKASYDDAAGLVAESPAVGQPHADFPAGSALRRAHGVSPTMPNNSSHPPLAPSTGRATVTVLAAPRPPVAAATAEGASDADDSEDESVADIARDLEAVADHCDIGIGDLFTQLRRAANVSGRPTGRRTAQSAVASTTAAMPIPLSSANRVGREHARAGSSNEASPLIGAPAAAASDSQPVGSAQPVAHTPSARIRIERTAPVLFDLDTLNEVEAFSSSVGVAARSLRSHAGASSLGRHAQPGSSGVASAVPLRRSPDGGLDAPLAETANVTLASRAVRFRPSQTPSDPSSDTTPFASATGGINGSRRASEGDLSAMPHAHPSEPVSSFRTATDVAATVASPAPVPGPTAKSAKIAPDKSDEDDEDRPRVRWADDIRRVYSYQVDNSVYITVEYARPLVGWLCLLFAVAMSSFDGVIQHYYLASGVTPYASFAWASLGQATIAVILFIVYTVVVGGLTRAEWRYLTTAMGWAQVAVVAFMFVMMALAEQAGSHMTKETRPFTSSAIHPLLIAGFGMVFKNTVFYEEIAGITVLLVGFGMAMLPADLHATRAYFAEVVYFSYGIFTASLLFACTRARARIPIPLLFLCMSLAFVVVQLPVCKLENMDASGVDRRRGLVGFAHASNAIPFVFITVFRSLSWILYLLALRFLPPVTVSAAMVIRPILSAFGVHVAYRVTDDDGSDVSTGWLGSPRDTQQRTAFWRFLSLNDPTVNGPSFSGSADPPLSSTSGGFGLGPFIPVIVPVTPPPTTSQAALFTPLFAVGACIAVSATIYVIYISSIKRQKVELLLRLLSKRRRPRNPYSSRRPRIDPVRTFTPDSSDRDSNSSAGTVDGYGTAAAVRGALGHREARGSPSAAEGDSDYDDTREPSAVQTHTRRVSPSTGAVENGALRRTSPGSVVPKSPRSGTPGSINSSSSARLGGSFSAGGVRVSTPSAMPGVTRSPGMRRAGMPLMSTSPKYMPTPPSGQTLTSYTASAGDVTNGGSAASGTTGSTFPAKPVTHGDYYDDDF